MNESEQEFANTADTNIIDDESSKSLVSCLRRSISSENNNSIVRAGLRVSFPENDQNLVTAYLEPSNPWDSPPTTPQDLRLLYEESCERHNTKPIEQVLDQLESCFSPCPQLSLTHSIDLSALEALEAILKRIRFQRLSICSEELAEDAAVALFDMLEYYECAAALVVCCQRGLGLRSWQACSRMLKKACCLVELDLSGTPINEQFMFVLCRALKVGTTLTSLHLNRCCVVGRTLAVLIVALRLNTQIHELTLCDNDLTAVDAVQLGSLLRDNRTLKYLDVSNNAIEDVGFANICDSLAEQGALKALVAWNTRLTDTDVLSALLLSDGPIETINVGQNKVGNEGLIRLKEALLCNQNLKQLGVQSVGFDCAGAFVLAEVIAKNAALQRIDARGNAIGREGLEALRDALVNGAVVQRLDLDQDGSAELNDLRREIHDLCKLNEARAQLEEPALPTTPPFHRKISLTCETLLRRDNPRGLLCEPKLPMRLRSPEPSPSSSPVPVSGLSRINRFQVSRVSEEPLPPATPVVSRFRVSVVDTDANPSISQTKESPRVVHVGFNTTKSATIAASPSSEQPQEVPRKRKTSAPPAAAKPQSSIDRLLGLFQNTASFFSSVTLTAEREKVQGQEEGTWEWDWSEEKS